MDPREQRGIIIAAMARIDRQDGAWMVPSQTAPERKYAVKLDGEGSCTCLDHTDGGFCCKHIRAVRIVLKREPINEIGKPKCLKKKTFQWIALHSFGLSLFFAVRGTEFDRECSGLHPTKPNPFRHHISFWFGADDALR